MSIRAASRIRLFHIHFPMKTNSSPSSLIVVHFLQNWPPHKNSRQPTFPLPRRCESAPNITVTTDSLVTWKSCLTNLCFYLSFFFQPKRLPICRWRTLGCHSLFQFTNRLEKIYSNMKSCWKVAGLTLSFLLRYFWCLIMLRSVSLENISAAVFNATEDEAKIQITIQQYKNQTTIKIQTLG